MDHHVPNRGDDITLPSELCSREIVYYPADTCNSNEEELKRRQITLKLYQESEYHYLPVLSDYMELGFSGSSKAKTWAP